MPEVKDQPKPEATESKKEVSYSDGFGEAWGRYVETPAPETKPEQKAEAKQAVEDDCPGCEKAERERRAKAKEQAERKPYKILKVQGKEVAVYSEQELIDMAQMGVDYTKKRQADSEEKKKWEGEIQTKHDELESLTDKFNKLMANLKPGEAANVANLPKPEPEKVDQKSVYEEYGIDPEYADAYQKKMINDVIDLRKKASLYDTRIGQVENMMNRVALKEAMGSLQDTIKKAREEFPLDEIMSEDGSENLTLKQFVALLKAKDEVSKARGQTVDINELAKETVKELHFLQSKAKTIAAPDIFNEMSEDDFMAKYPDLAKRLSVKLGTKAVAEHEAEEAKLPPSLETKKREVDLSAIPSKKPENTDDWIEAGFKDPEVLASFR